MSHTTEGHGAHTTAGHGGGHDDMDDMDMGHMMKMYFHAGTSETILLESWETSSVGGFIASAIGIFLLALIYEAMKFFREYLFTKSNAIPQEYSAQGLLGGIKENVFKRYHLIQTVPHMIQLVISYLLMLIFMTYNIWLGLAITLGAGLGYLLFGWNKRSTMDVTEHCH